EKAVMLSGTSRSRSLRRVAVTMISPSSDDASSVPTSLCALDCGSAAGGDASCALAGCAIAKPTSDAEIIHAAFMIHPPDFADDGLVPALFFRDKQEANQRIIVLSATLIASANK